MANKDRVDQLFNAGIHSLLTISLILIGLLLIRQYFENEEKNSLLSQDCVEGIQDLVMQKPYLRGVLDKGQPYQVLIMQKNCTQYTSGEAVSFKVSKNSMPITRVVRAVAGQKIELKSSNDRRAWVVAVDGHFIKDYRGEIYQFGVYPTPPPIGLYIKNNGHILHKGHYLLFSTVSPGVNDSGQFGIIADEAIVGLAQ